MIFNKAFYGKTLNLIIVKILNIGIMQIKPIIQASQMFNFKSNSFPTKKSIIITAKTSIAVFKTNRCSSKVKLLFL